MGGRINLAGLVDILLGFFDRHHTQEEVRVFLVSEYQSILEKKHDVENLYPFLGILSLLLAKLGWIEKLDSFDMDEIQTNSDLDEAIRWMEKLYGGHVISQSVVVAGAGENLDVLDSHRTKEDFVAAEAELLLRHVEYRRRKSMNEFSDDLSKEQVLKEKTNLSIFFSHHAMRYNDLRFLNAAFKLNEWLMGAYRKMRENDLRLPFLLALAEQEYAAQEMLR